MAAEQETYLAVLKASYDYDPQPDAQDELAIKENQLLFLLERTDEDWWKVKLKPDTQGEGGPSGLVPSAYVEPADPIQVAKVLYDYDAAAETELTVKEDEILSVYEKDEEWLLVQAQSGEGRVGYVPGNYVEEVSGDGEGEGAAPAPPAPAIPSISSIVIPDSPPQPPRPISMYVDPAERVAATSNKAQADSIQTWAISEIDAKGKKKKGTLGIGNGAMFFASESDKNPVRKWQTSDIKSVRLEKHKHVHIEVGADVSGLHFHAGSKDTAEAIMTKLDSSRALANDTPATNGDSTNGAAPSSSAEAALADEDRPRLREQKSVHFAPDEPEEIPPPEAYSEEEDEGHGGLAAVVLYDFTADGEDELSVVEGETLTVLEKDSDEWWKIRNSSGAEGVVPASYVELVGGASPGDIPSVLAQASGQSAAAAAAGEAAERAAKEAAEREEQEEEERHAAGEREREDRDREKQEAKQRAKAAAAAEADRERRQEQKKKKEEEEERERERSRAAAEEEAKKRKLAEQRAAERKKSSDPGRSSGENKRGPPPESLREWRDRTGQFRVDAAFLGFANGKLRLHKINGVVIEVPAEKMSEEDLRYVQKLTRQKNGQPSHRKSDDDDEPLELRRRSLIPEKASSPPKTAPFKKGPTVDWFEFFLNAGCDLDDCTRYATAFERDKIDEAILPDITESTMRSLGLREGDIIRVKKAIEQRKPKSNDAKEEQLRKDEELARQLQAEESGSSLKARSAAPNLFSGSNGELKNMRRGRPQSSKTLPPTTVDLQSISSASDQMQRSSSPLVNSPETIQPTQLPPKSATAAPPISGFDDDAWTNRPSSTKPVASTPPVLAPRAPSAPPAPPPPPPAPTQRAGPPTVTVSPPARAASVASGAPTQQSQVASTPGTDDDIFNQLARIASLRVNSPAAPQPTPAAVSGLPPRAASTSFTPPAGFQSGMGMGTSPVPMGAALQAQQTGMLSPSVNGPRGPFAPVPANQSLLQPLVPTTTGFNGFVPTRPGTSPSSFQAQSPFQSGPPAQQSLLPQQTGYMGPGAALSMLPQQTGFRPQSALMPQPTGFASGGFGGSQSLPSFQSTPNYGMMQPSPTGFNPVQSNPTGYNPGFGQSPFGNAFSVPTPPPAPSAPSQSPVNTNPANIFAQMKSGTFAQDDSQQLAEKYDALRPNPLTAQPTGWGGFGGVNGFQGQGGYGYHH